MTLTTSAAVERSARGAEVVTPPYPEGNLVVAVLRDPADNVVGGWQNGRRH